MVWINGFPVLAWIIFIIATWVETSLGEIMMNPQIAIPDGLIMGEMGSSNNERAFYKFWCIPYGTAGRFEAAVPPKPWTGVRDATSCFSRCPQFMPIAGIDIAAAPDGVEDCQILNVFVPKFNHTPFGKTNLPVMVYIHGGYFQMGSGLDYSAELFMDEDVIMITINYRLGPLGFLASGDGVVEANLGLKDQVLSLKWVQKNIQYFGGDPEKVTIFGESAGSGSVSFLVLSPMTKGLFRNAIGQSGTTLSAWSFQSKPREVFANFVEELNCTMETSEEALVCLKTKDIEEIQDVAKKTKWFAELLHPMFPSIETEPPRNGNPVFLPDHPKRMYQRGEFNYVPFIQGINEDEGAYQGGLTINDHELLGDVNQRWLTVGPILVGMDTRNITRPKMNLGLRKLRHFYFGDEDIVNNQENLQKLTDIYSDAWFIAGFRMTIRFHSKHAPVYPYFFTKKGALRVVDTIGWFNRSVTSHADDLQYLFYKGMAADKSDADFSKNFVHLWVSFARNGRPTDMWGSAKVWPVADLEKGIKLMNLDDNTAVIDEPFKARADFWEMLGNNEWKEYSHIDAPEDA